MNLIYRYNKIAGMVKSLSAKLRDLNYKDPFRIQNDQPTFRKTVSSYCIYVYMAGFGVTVPNMCS